MGIVNFGLLSQIGTPAQIASFTRSFERPGELARQRRRELEAQEEAARSRQAAVELEGVRQRGRLGLAEFQAGAAQERQVLGALEARRAAGAEQQARVGLERERQAGRLELARERAGLISPFQAGSLGLRAEELGLRREEFEAREEERERRRPLEQVQMRQAVANLQKTFLENERSVFDFEVDKRKDKVARAQALNTVTATLNAIPEGAQREKYFQDNRDIIRSLDPDAPSNYTQEWHAAINIAGNAINETIRQNPQLAVDAFSPEGQSLTRRLLEARAPLEEQLDKVGTTPPTRAEALDPNEGRIIVNKETGERRVIRGGQAVPLTEEEEREI